MTDFDVFVPPRPLPPGGSLPMSYRQGKIITFDPLTLENTVLVGQTVLENIPLVGVAEAASLRPNVTVAVAVVATPGSSLASYLILGRLVRPGTADATAAINALNDRMSAAAIVAGTIGSTNSINYVDLSAAGPVVTDVHVGPSGRVLLLLGCNINSGASDGATGGEMSVKISGATTRAATSAYAFRAQAAIFGNNPSSVQVDTTFNNRACMVSIVSGLTPGDNTFTAMYAASTSSSTISFSDPIIAVLAL